MLDHVQIILWSIAYVLIIYNEIKYRNEKACFMPLVSGCLNFAWEINAICFGGRSYAHWLWASLDTVIFLYNLWVIKNVYGKIKYSIALLGMICVLAYVFQIKNGMLISVFTIDLIMAADFVRSVRNISLHGKIPIAVAKLLGDAAAWLHYLSKSSVVTVIGIVVLLLNLYYLCYCLEERSRAGKLQRKR